MRVTSLVVFFLLVTSGFSPEAGARQRKLKKPPPPLNRQVKYEAYPDTDIAMITYLTSRQEFRVGHSPYRPERFHLAEFILISEHHRKYLRPDFKAEIKMAPGRAKPALMANQVFQRKWKDLLKNYRDMFSKFKKIKIPKIAREVFAAYQAPLEDEIFLAAAVAGRMFPSQKTRARERLRQDLKDRFRQKNPEWFDRLFDDFERDADLSRFYPRFVDLFIEPGLAAAKEKAEKLMKKTGLEYATAVQEEEKDVLE